VTDRRLGPIADPSGRFPGNLFDGCTEVIEPRLRVGRRLRTEQPVARLAQRRAAQVGDEAGGSAAAVGDRLKPDQAHGPAGAQQRQVQAALLWLAARDEEAGRQRVAPGRWPCRAAGPQGQRLAATRRGVAWLEGVGPEPALRRVESLENRVGRRLNDPRSSGLPALERAGQQVEVSIVPGLTVGFLKLDRHHDAYLHEARVGLGIQGGSGDGPVLGRRRKNG
jgi:hypothetical protein